MDYSALQPEELIKACADSTDQAAWQEFIHRFNPLITRVIHRAALQCGGAPTSTVEDLVQETYLKLCAKDRQILRTFESRYPNAAYGFLKVIAVNVALDHFKESRALKRAAENDSARVTSETIETQHTGASSQESVERDILLKEIDQLLVEAIPGEDLARYRIVFWLYFRSGMTAKAIASIPAIGLTTKGVESLILRLTRQIRSALQARGESTAERAIVQQKGFRQLESL
jgi:RNA polymerase sigma-70 factor (ECF subfamily)